MSARADLILRNVRPHGGVACDVAITGGRITAMEPRLEIAGPEIDGKGRDLIPGLHDHHLHLLATAARRLSLDLSGCTSTAAVGAALSQHAAGLEPGVWLRATGLAEQAGVLPDRHQCDQWVNDRPLRIQDRTGALWLLNSPALAALGPGPWPACVERDESGSPTGRIWRGDAWLRSALPASLPCLRALSHELAGFGITSLTDAGASNGQEEAALFSAACRSGDLLQRLTLMGREDLPRGDVFKRGPLKLLYDESALPVLSEVSARIVVARQQGRTVAAHCVTLGELLFFLGALDMAGGVQAGDRIEHGSVIPESLLTDIARAGLTIVTQPGFVRTRGDRYLANVDQNDVPNLYRLHSLIVAGIPVLAGSDAPYGNLDPWEAIKAAMTRSTQSGAILEGNEKVTLLQAMRLYSADQPIEPGQAADLCLLGTPLSALSQGWSGNPVELTIINGVAIGSE